ncbi:MAG: FecR domain-containing protein, partial [Candidatus Gracilibacteria bacterium]|nr:FecR domain-containing protein [Candidatus Gracilibacteria bacterium]
YKQAPIIVGDKIRTLADSQATVFWPDGSVTRLGEKSSIKINEMKAKSISENIQIDFSLEQGKSWSNVIRYLYDTSYFHERFNNETALATVRGTVFEINLDNQYVHTVDHSISVEDLKNKGKSVLVTAGGVLDTRSMQILLRKKLDEAWNTLNKSEDIMYMNERMEMVKKQLGGYLSGDQKTWDTLQKTIESDKDTEKTKATLMNMYQEINGLQNTPEVLSTKMRLRDLIIQSSDEGEKQQFLSDFARFTLYDSWKAPPTQTGTVQELKKKMDEYIKQGADGTMINRLRDAAGQEGVQKLNESLENIKQQTIETLGKENLLERAKEFFTK